MCCISQQQSRHDTSKSMHSGNKHALLLTPRTQRYVAGSTAGCVLKHANMGRATGGVHPPPNTCGHTLQRCATSRSQDSKDTACHAGAC